MSEAGRRAYLGFGTFFLVVGAAFLLVGVVRLAFLPDLLRGNPVPVALLLLAIGAGLRGTVRRDERLAAERAEAADDEGAHDALDDEETDRIAR